MFDQETPDPGRRAPFPAEDSGAFPDATESAIERSPKRPEKVPKERPVPSSVGPFSIVEKLGTGAMGEVYLARDQRLERWVALKRVQPDRYGEESVARFRREARAAAKLHHRAIVQIHDLVETDESDWLVMERLEGESLAERLKVGPLTALDAVYAAGRISEGLAVAHAAGVMHRDLKASNIMLTPNGVKILDFGLAKSLPGSPREDTGVTTEGQLIGTIASMAPEQAKGLDVDERADLFALGMLIYEMLTGVSPFKRRTALATMNAICDAPAEKLDRHIPDLPSALVELVHRLLAKDPADRPAGGAQEVVEKLRQVRAELGGSSSSGGSNLEPLGHKRPRLGLFIALPFAVIAAGLLGVWILGSSPEEGQPTPQRPLRLVVSSFEFQGLESRRFFAQGLAEEIRSRLSALENVRLIQPLERQVLQEEMNRLLSESGVDFLLEGDVHWPQGQGDVAVELRLRRLDGDVAWQAVFEERPDEFLALQAKLANDVATNLPIEVSELERRSVRLQGTFNQAAYLAYLEGLDWERRSRFSREFIERALFAYQKAVDEDAGFIDAHARLIRFQSLEYLNRARSPEKAIDIERHLAALEHLAPAQAATRLAAAEVAYRVQGDYTKAIRELEAVLELEPSNGDALATLGYVQRRQGRFASAVESFEGAHHLAPFDASLPAFIAETLRANRRFAEALPWYRTSLRLMPTDGWVRGQAAFCLLEMQGCDQESCDIGPALALLDAAPDLGDEAVRLHRFWLTLAAAKDGDLEAMAGALEHLPATFDEEVLALVAFPSHAAVLMALGRDDELATRRRALRSSLEQAIELDAEYPTSRSFLALVLALDDDPASFAEAAEHAVEAIRLAKKDAFSGPRSIERWAMALALSGHAEEAIALLEPLLERRYQRAITRQSLRLDPVWSAIRLHPEGEQLIHSVE